MINRINPKEAPEGYVARRPKQRHKEYRFWLCNGCTFFDERCLKGSRETSCFASLRNDGRTVIFVKKKT